MDVSLIADELTADPLVRGYAGMTDQQAADDLNIAYRDGDAEAGALFNYLAKETARDDAAEGTPTPIIGRLCRINEAGIAAVNAAPPDNKVFGSTAPFSVLTAVRLDACRALLKIAEQDRLGALTRVMTDAALGTLLDHVKDCGVMKAADVNAIKALSQNKQTRGNEIGFGRVKPQHVRDARNG